MAGYSGTPLPRKLGIREHSRVRFLAAPQGFAHSLGLAPRARGEADVIVAFFTSRARLAKAFGGLRATLDPAGGLWIAAQESFRRGHRPRREHRPRDRSRGAAGRQQGVRDRRRLVRPALRRAREGSLIPASRAGVTRPAALIAVCFPSRPGQTARSDAPITAKSFMNQSSADVESIRSHATSSGLGRSRGRFSCQLGGPVGLLRITRAELVHGKLLGAIAIMIARFPVLKASQL